MTTHTQADRLAEQIKGKLADAMFRASRGAEFNDAERAFDAAVDALLALAKQQASPQAQVREQAALEGLSAQIMNIRCQNPPPISLSSGFTAQREAQAYREGHRDARHAAAELVDARVSLTGTVSTGGNE